VFHSYSRINVVKSRPNIIERAITELVEVTVVILLHNVKSGYRNNSSSGVNIFRRSQVASIPVEALAFGTPV
nr:hypothetical protein [Tanacetum cinerariifolium]